MTLREERKQQTRAALLQAALKLASGGRSLAGLSLREVAREAGVVPTAFYRHFRDMDELGLALADEVGLTLRRLLRQARANAVSSPNLAIQTSVRTFLEYVRANPAAFEILARERTGAPPRVREAVNQEVRIFVRELAADLRILPAFSKILPDDMEMIADLVINAALTQAGEILQLPRGQSQREQELTVRIIQQVRLILLGALQWKSDRGAVQALETASR